MAANTFQDIVEREKGLKKTLTTGQITMIAIGGAIGTGLFLGSGFYDFHQSDANRLNVTLATDVGGGTSFSMFRTMNAAHKVARMGGYYLTALRMFYLATRAAAEALGWTGRVGSFSEGCEADFVVLDPKATPLIARRSNRSETLEEELFAFAMLGDDRVIDSVYIMGEPVRAAA